jgi:antitoxin (DNA-binding transcriptional repressor) of toxin-antitoxin stability system
MDRPAARAIVDLITEAKCDIKLNMKKINSRAFQQRFGQIAEQLKAGQTLEVTKRGQPLGQFIKMPLRRVPMPDFAANLEKLDYSEELGAQIIEEFSASLS